MAAKQAECLAHPRIQTILNAVKGGLLFVSGEHADDGEGDQKSGDHGLEVMCGALPLRFLQGHSPSGEPQCLAVAGMQEGSGEVQVNSSEPFYSHACRSLAPADSQ